jgi:hypothetical protein
VELAFQWLESPSLAPPKELPELSQLEWFLLQRMLESLWLEKKLSPLQ